MLPFKKAADFADLQKYLQHSEQEAIVQCLTDLYEKNGSLQKNRYYKAIASSEAHGGCLLIIEDNMNCCWFPRQLFKIVFDPYSVLSA
ncbi:MAG: hypothetical protein IJP33_00850 [Firmicutes bacterium]|nr:hypothetical protein [Bacillota bacterium]